MIDPKQALSDAWSAYRDEFIPNNASDNQKSAMAYAYYRGMQGMMEMLHKAMSVDHEPTGQEMTDFMNGLQAALIEFYSDHSPSTGDDK